MTDQHTVTHPTPADGPSARSLRELTATDWERIETLGDLIVDDLPDRLLDLVERTRHDPTYGFPVNGFEHSVQTASRALRGGESCAYVIAALMHDAFEPIAPFDHGDAAATAIGPLLPDELAWMVRHHSLIQKQHFLHHPWWPSQLPAAIDHLRSEPFFETTERFCAVYDQAAFDPDYISLPLDEFRPLLVELIEPHR